MRIEKLIIFLVCSIALFGTRPLHAGDADDVKDVPAELRTVKGEKDQHYYLIGDIDVVRDKPPALLVVLPGGDGSKAFHPFVRRIWKNALSADWLIAQLIAVPSDQKDQIVWPAGKLTDPKQTFTTETFIRNVIAEVKTKSKNGIDLEQVYILAWSSGGPAAYCAMIEKDSPIKGAMIAMSVFHPEQMPALEGAKGKRIYLLHSPQDRVCPIEQARAAEKALAAAGAHTKLTTYEGGHGWRGDVYGSIKDGIAWLETPAASKTEERTRHR